MMGLEGFSLFSQVITWNPSREARKGNKQNRELLTVSATAKMLTLQYPSW